MDIHLFGDQITFVVKETIGNNFPPRSLENLLIPKALGNPSIPKAHGNPSIPKALETLVDRKFVSGVQNVNKCVPWKSVVR